MPRSTGDFIRMTPREIVASHNLEEVVGTSGRKPNTNPEEYLGMKLDISKRKPSGVAMFRASHPNIDSAGWDGGLFDKMKKEGFDESKPILVQNDHPSGKPTVIDGHHRLSVALNIFPDTPIPVRSINSEQLQQMRDARGPGTREAYNKKRAYAKTERLATKTHKEQLARLKPNIYEGNCATCGEKVGKGEGMYLKTKIPRGVRGGKYEVYHNDHLPKEAR